MCCFFITASNDVDCPHTGAADVVKFVRGWTKLKLISEQFHALYSPQCNADIISDDLDSVMKFQKVMWNGR
jgi:hypothetical protein